MKRRERQRQADLHLCLISLLLTHASHRLPSTIAEPPQHDQHVLQKARINTREGEIEREEGRKRGREEGRQTTRKREGDSKGSDRKDVRKATHTHTQQKR